MKYNTKSVVIGRKKSKGDYHPCFICLFDVNDPHLKNEVPKKIFEYSKIDKVIVDNLKINYLLPGNDLVINDLEHIEIKKNKNNIVLNGKHK